MADFAVNLFVRPFQTQLDIAQCEERTIFIGGGYGSGKTTGAALAAFIVMCSNPWREEYGANNPTFVVSAPTARVMRDTTLPALLKVIPPECIKRHRKAENELVLTNGVVIKLRSGKSTFEGLTIFGIWIDECSHYDEQFFINAIGRVRDPLAIKEKIIVSGVPYEGSWVEQQFRLPREGQRTFMLSAISNPFLSKKMVYDIMSRVSKADAETLIYGRWMKQRDLIFPEFSMSKHIRPVKFDPSTPYYLGIDPGKNHSVCLVAQKFDMRLSDGTKVEGMNIVDEVIMNQASVEALLLEVKRLGYTRPTKAFIDPTTRLDETNAIKRVFPGMTILQQAHRSVQGSEDYGLDCMRTALCDAADNVRLFISDRLKPSDDGLVRCLQSYRWNLRTERPQWADDLGDHSVDACRYLCVGLIPIQSGFRPFTIRKR